MHHHVQLLMSTVLDAQNNTLSDDSTASDWPYSQGPARSQCPSQDRPGRSFRVPKDFALLCVATQEKCLLLSSQGWNKHCAALCAQPAHCTQARTRCSSIALTGWAQLPSLGLATSGDATPRFQQNDRRPSFSSRTMLPG